MRSARSQHLLGSQPRLVCPARSRVGRQRVTFRGTFPAAPLRTGLDPFRSSGSPVSTFRVHLACCCFAPSYLHHSLCRDGIYPVELRENECRNGTSGRQPESFSCVRPLFVPTQASDLSLSL